MANAADVDQHAEQIAGIMISKNATTLAGVAPDASLYSSAFVTLGTNPGYQHALLSTQHVATQPNVRAVNHSWGKAREAAAPLDGNSLLSLGMDWSASVHDVLHVVAGNEGTAIPIPTDIYNGMVVAYSERVGGVWSKVGVDNTFNEDAFGDRTSVSILAPGEGFPLTNLGTMSTVFPHPSGASNAAPHVTGTVALLQQFATPKLMAPAPPHWDADARRHEVMKAVMMNSADKIKDDGLIVPPGSLGGMERTVTDQAGDNWFQSPALNNTEMPLDIQMGAGHLNVKRALRQYRNGEFDADVPNVPVIGWDYGTTTGTDDINKYVLSQQLVAGSYITVTLAWDRPVQFNNDAGTMGVYDVGDTFVTNPQFNDLDVYLMSAGDTMLEQFHTRSNSGDMTLEHIWFSIPQTGLYEIWVHQFSADVGAQDYALAWWGVSTPGDYNHDSVVDMNDYDQWKMDYGSTTNLAADGNGDGMVNSADYTVWRNALAGISFPASGSSVPEPTSAAMLLLAAACFAVRRPSTF